MQLCAQVRRALHGVIPLPGVSCLEGLVVEAVEPDPDASRLRVVISVPAASGYPIAALRKRLTDMVGFIRSEVAPQIHRKRVPLLTFELVPREDDT
jgi:ribosome-binding factor A